MGSEIITVWTHHDESFGGISPVDDREFVRAINTHGHAVVTDSRHIRPMNHHVVGVGVGHDDAMFCETRGRDSMAAFYENGGSGTLDVPRWWEDGCLSARAYYDQTHPRFFDKTGHNGTRVEAIR